MKKKHTETTEAPAPEAPALSLVPPAELAISPVEAVAAAPKVAVPTMTRIVLFTDEAGVTSPAMVTGVDADGTVSLEVFYRDGVAGHSKRSGISHANDGHGWRWQPRA